jgi:hypothetical protein
MNRRDFIKTSMAGAALAALPRWALGGESLPAGDAKRPPNVVMIFVDDLGYAVEDLEEKNNRISQNPEVVKDLVARLKTWQQAGGLTPHRQK